MNRRYRLLNCILCSILMIAIPISMNAQHNTNSNQGLKEKEKYIVTISALTAAGNLESLSVQLGAGLDAGLTVNEIKEILVQLYAYCGFPRSLNAITTFMKVMDQRKTRGIIDSVGENVTTVSNVSDKYERGRKVLEELTKTPQAKPAPIFGEFVPRIDTFLKEHLFADIFDSNILNYKERELVTISALSAMEGVKPQLQSHVKMGINTGVTKEQLLQVAYLIRTHIGEHEYQAAWEVFSVDDQSGK